MQNYFGGITYKKTWGTLRTFTVPPKLIKDFSNSEILRIKILLTLEYILYLYERKCLSLIKCKSVKKL